MGFSQLKKTSTKFRPTDKRNRQFRKGVFISLLLMLTPFVFYLYRFAPDAESWDIGILSINSGGFDTVFGMVHALFTKITFLILTTTWFFTCKHWWKYAILVPFGMFFFQLTGVLNHQIQYTDDFNFWSVLPVLSPVVIGMVLISIKLNKRTKLLDIREQVKHEMQVIRNERNKSAS